jgi:hypothetical protein
MLRAMELILAILGAGPIGWFSPTRRRALTIYLGLWAVVFPIQTIVVFSAGDGQDTLYWVFNALILSAGIALNQLGTALAERRRTKLGVAGAA